MEEAIRGKRQLTEAEVAEIELTTGIETDQKGAQSDRSEMLRKLADAGWTTARTTRNPTGVEVHLRPAAQTSGKPTRSIFSEDEDDAIRKELKRLEKGGES